MKKFLKIFVTMLILAIINVSFWTLIEYLFKVDDFWINVFIALCTFYIGINLDCFVEDFQKLYNKILNLFKKGS